MTADTSHRANESVHYKNMTYSPEMYAGEMARLLAEHPDLADHPFFLYMVRARLILSCQTLPGKRVSTEVMWFAVAQAFQNNHSPCPSTAPAALPPLTALTSRRCRPQTPRWRSTYPGIQIPAGSMKRVCTIPVVMRSRSALAVSLTRRVSLLQTTATWRRSTTRSASCALPWKSTRPSSATGRSSSFHKVCQMAP